MRVENHLDSVARAAIHEALGVEAQAIVRSTSDAKHGDYQVNGVLPLAKEQKKNPRELATAVANVLRNRHADLFAHVEVAGPGFINLRIHPTWMSNALSAQLRDTERDGVPVVDKRERIVVDFSSPNIAKQMHVGHLRSTIIGDAIVRLLRFQGHDVIGDNHIGDWGTQFGLLIVGMRRWGSEEALAKEPVEELERVYKLASNAAKEDAALAEEARAELAKLQTGDKANYELWKHFIDVSRTSLDRTYGLLGVQFDEWLGESAYNDMLPGVAKMLVDQNIAREDEGALCVFFAEHENAPADLRKVKEPFIVRKKDGAFLYSTTDIATILYRRDRFHADRSIYVVDVRQSLHFKQLFAVSQMLGIKMNLSHVGFGTVLGADGKPLKTRDGTPVTLASLLKEAVDRALARIREEGLDVPESDLESVAQAVGVGAVKYADLRQNRISDYQFDWDKMISFKGNAGPYIQYAYARIRSIFRKGDFDFASFLNAKLELNDPAEVALGRQLLRFADNVYQAADGSLPHLICDHLYELSRLYSTFYEACPVLRAEPAVRDSRLALSALCARQLTRGLGLLGIQAIERM